MVTAREIIKSTLGDGKARPQHSPLTHAMSDPSKPKPNLAAYIFSANIVTGASDLLDESLKPEYRGHPIGFWHDLEVIYLDEFLWGKRGFTDIGQGMFDKVVDKWTFATFNTYGLTR